jgi:hypothetical protein
MFCYLLRHDCQLRFDRARADARRGLLSRQASLSMEGSSEASSSRKECSISSSIASLSTVLAPDNYRRGISRIHAARTASQLCGRALGGNSRLSYLPSAANLPPPPASWATSTRVHWPPPAISATDSPVTASQPAAASPSVLLQACSALSDVSGHAGPDDTDRQGRDHLSPLATTGPFTCPCASA